MIVYLLGKADPELVPRYGYEAFLWPEALERMMVENPLEIHIRPELSIMALPSDQAEAQV